MSKTQLYVNEAPPIWFPRTVLSRILEGFVRFRDGRIMYVVRKPDRPTNTYPVWSDKTIARTPIADSLDLGQEVSYVNVKDIGIEKVVRSD